MRRRKGSRRRREKGCAEFSEIWVVYSYSNTSVTLLLHLPLCSGSQEEQGQRAYSIAILIRNINEFKERKEETKRNRREKQCIDDKTYLLNVLALIRSRVGGSLNSPATPQ